MTIDNMSTMEVLIMINNEGMSVAYSVQKVLPEVEEAVEAV